MPRKGKGSKDKAKVGVKRALNDINFILEDAKWDSGDFDLTMGVTRKLVDALAALEAAQPRRFGDGDGVPAQAPWDDRLARFVAWLRDEHGVTAVGETVNIASAGAAGTGLVAARPLAAGDAAVTIPVAAMVSTETALQSQMGDIILEDSYFQQLPVITLAVHVLSEVAAGDASAWAPYLRVLPDKTNVFLYYSSEAFRRLRPSPAALMIIRMLRTTAKHYMRLHENVYREGRLPWLQPVFTWAWFRWATAMVMTRQNNIPVGGPNGNMLALVPLWDMANHEEGPMTTSYDSASKCLRCTAQRAFGAGEPFTMCYGERGNGELLQYSGFVVRDNSADTYPLTAALPDADADPLHRIRVMVLKTLGVAPMSRPRPDGTSEEVPNRWSFMLGGREAGTSPEGLPDGYVRFCRIAHMSKGELQAALKARDAAAATPVSDENEAKALALHASVLQRAIDAFEADVRLEFESVEGLHAQRDAIEGAMRTGASGGASGGAGGGEAAAAAGSGEGDPYTDDAACRWVTLFIAYEHLLLKRLQAAGFPLESIAVKVAEVGAEVVEAAVAGGAGGAGGAGAGAASASSGASGTGTAAAAAAKPSPFVLRYARASDAAAIYDVTNAAYALEKGDTGVAFKRPDTERFNSRAQVDELLARPADAGGVIVAEEPAGEGGGAPPAVVACVSYDFNPEASAIHFGPMSVLPSHQKRGLGRLLLTAMEAQAAARGLKRIEIEVVNHRTDLMSFYPRFGYAVTGTKPFESEELGHSLRSCTRECHFVVLEKSVDSAVKAEVLPSGE